LLDIIFRDATVVDGTGLAPYVASVAVRDGQIVDIGTVQTHDAQEIVDAKDLYLTPGFIDVHTHYDGQVTWDDVLLPSSAHGVTTVVMGNCGVGFSPVRPGSERWLIQLMEGVEDIPGTALYEGIRWSWESFPEYLEAIDRKYAIDIAAQVPHGALRAYVMGERGAADEAATADDIALMARLVQEAVEAGAVGFSSSRTAIHQAKDGRYVPGTMAPIEELLRLGRAMGAGGGAVFELVPSGRGIPGIGDPWTAAEELELIRRFAEETSQPVTFSVGQSSYQPEVFDQVLDYASRNLSGLPVFMQFSGRCGGVLSSLRSSHAFQRRPTFVDLAELPLAEQAARLADPQVKARALSESDLPPKGAAFTDRFDEFLRNQFANTFRLGEPPDYEPAPSTSILAKAKESGADPLEFVYDRLIDDDGRAVLISITSNYATGDYGCVEELLRRDGTVLGLGDGGAHVRYICDASTPTYMLTHWTRDRTRGQKVAIETAVAKQTGVPAALYGFADRGTIEAGKRADLNLVDMRELRLDMPRFANDLPTGSMRVLQDAHGYVMTMVNGVATRRNDEDTGARPGRLVRGSAR
jgi:N-acyl-D-amino-acid deacylase